MFIEKLVLQMRSAYGPGYSPASKATETENYIVLIPRKLQ